MRAMFVVAVAAILPLGGCAAFDEWGPADPYAYGYGAYPQRQCVGYANIGPGGSDDGRPLAADGYSTWTGATQPCSQATVRTYGYWY